MSWITFTAAAVVAAAAAGLLLTDAVAFLGTDVLLICAVLGTAILLAGFEAQATVRVRIPAQDGDGAV
jgi:hypothetical protein